MGKYKHVSFDGENILIHYRGGQIYDVALSRCDRADRVLDWIHQLHIKTWMTAEMEHEFIDMLLELIPTEMWSGAGFKGE